MINNNPIQLSDVLHWCSAIEGCREASLSTFTIPVLKGGKKNPFQGRVRKQTTDMIVYLFANNGGQSGYEQLVREKIPDFVVGPLPFGERIGETPIIYHRGTHYLQTIIKDEGIITYTLDNVFVPDPSAIEGLDLTPRPSKSQGLSAEEKILVKTLKLESIVSLRLL